MLFNSFYFLLFFPFVTIIYFLLPHKFRWFHLLAASCFFYMVFVPKYILILFFTIIIDYIAGIMIENAQGNTRKKFLIMSIVANLGVLCFFKYYNFFIENSNELLLFFHSKSVIPYLNIILPIGLSFHTFQAMSYTIEVYRGNQKAERHFGIYSLYVMFYPQLVAGPIERPQNLLYQFYEKHNVVYDDVVKGLRLILWGLVKKVVIADNLALVIKPCFDNPKDCSGIMMAIAAIFFAFEIYCDFSGYSDIAIGTARVMGFKLMINFDHPFSSKTVTEFWRKWHISLTTWFYDYLFNPIIYSLRKYGKIAIAIGLLLTFFLSGLWHGAGWKFIICGLLNGLALVYEYFTKEWRVKAFRKLPISINNTISKILTFGFISICWVFFRAKNVHEALVILNKIMLIPKEIGIIFKTKKIAFLNLPGIINILLPSFGLIIFLLIAQYINLKFKFSETYNKKPVYIRWGLYYIGVFAVVCATLQKNVQSPFIYFQF